MIKINGNKIAKKIINELKTQPKPNKILAVILVGDDKSSKLFLNQKRKIALKLGIDFKTYEFDERITQNELEEVAGRLNDDERVGGIIIQLPLPKGIDCGAVIDKLSTEKDIDNLTGEARVLAPAAAVARDILSEVGWDWNNKIVAIVGQGFLVGQPITRWLSSFSLSATNLIVKTADINTKDLKNFLTDVDLIISGVGKKDLINPKWLKGGASVIDFGCPADLNNHLPAASFQRLKFYTPTPGGTGPILVAELFRNFYELNT